MALRRSCWPGLIGATQSLICTCRAGLSKLPAMRMTPPRNEESALMALNRGLATRPSGFYTVTRRPSEPVKACGARRAASGRAARQVAPDRDARPLGFACPRLAVQASPGRGSNAVGGDPKSLTPWPANSGLRRRIRRSPRRRSLQRTTSAQPSMAFGHAHPGTRLRGWPSGPESPPACRAGARPPGAG